MALKFYYDLMSQPSRTVYMFLKLNKISFEDKKVALRKGEHKTEEFAKINPLQLVPVINDNGFILTESIAIVEYLSSTRSTPDHWYPRSDPQKRARVNEYLHWHHLNTRLGCSMVIQHLMIIPRMTGNPVNMGKVNFFRQKVREVVKHLEEYYLAKTPFLSSDIITIADLFCACELQQLYPVLEEGLYESSAVVMAWMARVREETNPFFDEAHQVGRQVRVMYEKVKAQL